jgi:membrane protein insertase Oxa1/YidC/SpoIIIJ
MMQTNPQPPTLDESQEMMQKQMQTLMPIMFLGVFFFIPVPAGIFLYLIATNVFQAMQSALLPKLMPAEEKSDDQQPPAN